MPILTKTELLTALSNEFPSRRVSRSQLIEYMKSHQPETPFPHWLTNDQSLRLDRGVYSIPDSVPNTSAAASVVTDAADDLVAVDTEMDARIKAVSKPETAKQVSTAASEPSHYSRMSGDPLIPQRDNLYIPFGNYADIRDIIASRRWNPVFVTGLSGNGKTYSILQACAELKRECFRVNITVETDEDDLLGGLRLENGNTEFQYGPVVEAMLRGAVCLLDEVDLGSNKLMCLQPVLEGRGVYLKKVNQYVEPAPGFNILATANTKGQGSDSGKFVGTNVLNEAFLERFPVTLEQDYPPLKDEKKILIRYMEHLGCRDDDFIVKLCEWAKGLRKMFSDQVCEEVMTTRRLVHVLTQYSIFKDREKAIRLVTNRFTPEIQKSWRDFYAKIDATVGAKSATAGIEDAVASSTSPDEIDIPDGTVIL